MSRRSFSNPSDNDTRSILSIHPNVGRFDIVRRRPSLLPCIFAHCLVSFRITSTSREEWYSHSLSYFQEHEPPRSCLCIFCDTLFFSDDPQETWQKRMEHIGDHLENGWTIDRSRPDFALVRHLWSNSLPSKMDYENALSSTERPHIGSLRPLDWLPEERLKSQRRRVDLDRVIIDQAQRR
jgi:hypothetical protein